MVSLFKCVDHVHFYVKNCERENGNWVREKKKGVGGALRCEKHSCLVLNGDFGCREQFGLQKGKRVNWQDQIEFLKNLYKWVFVHPSGILGSFPNYIDV